MSKRRRRQEKGTETLDIEWLKHRAGYPSPEEREKIIRLRSKLGSEMLLLAIVRAGQDDPRYRDLIKKYGSEEVRRAEQVFREGLDMPSRVADEAKSNRDYRLRYSRFGAGLPFYTVQERDDLLEKYAHAFTGTDESEGKIASTEIEEAQRLLLMNWRDWEDITPLAVPSRPSDYNAPLPKSYPAPIAELLEWGNDLNKHYDFADEQEYVKWKKFIPGLTRMALDPGLLDGWPADSASWTPWHAIHLLGELQAWESAPALATLADLENDWLSDHLPHIWAEMGPEAEPVLWMMVDDDSASATRRGLAAEALYMTTNDNEIMDNKVVKGFEKRLQKTASFDPTLNGYLIIFLKDMGAVEDIYRTITEAFEQDRVDPDIITLEDLENDDFEEDDFDEQSD